MKRRFTVDASKKISAAMNDINLHRYFDNLDDRYDFELPDEFEIYYGNTLVTCITVDSNAINESYLEFDIEIAIPAKDSHWQSDEWIGRGLDSYLKSLTDGSDYYYEIVDDIENAGWISSSDNFNDDMCEKLGDCRLYKATVAIIPVTYGWDEE